MYMCIYIHNMISNGLPFVQCSFHKNPKDKPPYLAGRFFGMCTKTMDIKGRFFGALYHSHPPLTLPVQEILEEEVTGGGPFVFFFIFKGTQKDFEAPPFFNPTSPSL